MKIAVLGGTFNPPHIGHLFLAEEVRCAFGFDRIIMVPAYLPAHKKVAGEVAAHDRLALCQAAVRNHSAFIVDDCEIKRRGVSYMIETMRDIMKRITPEGKPGLILGDDLCAGFPDWRKAAELAELTRVILVHRQATSRVSFPFPHEYFGNRMLPLSSSEIRERIRRRLPVRFLVPDAVLEYIEAKGLYRA